MEIAYFIEKITTTHMVHGTPVDNTKFHVMYRKSGWFSRWKYIEDFHWHSEKWIKVSYTSLRDAQIAIHLHRDSLKKPQVVRQVLCEDGTVVW